MIRPNINVTPLIDVLLVLLIIFMVAMPLKPTKIEASIPQPPKKGDVAEANEELLVVELKRDLSIQLNNELTYGSLSNLEKLSSDLESIFEKRRVNYLAAGESEFPRVVFVKAPKSIRYGDDGRAGRLRSPNRCSRCETCSRAA